MLLQGCGLSLAFAGQAFGDCPFEVVACSTSFFARKGFAFHMKDCSGNTMIGKSVAQLGGLVGLANLFGDRMLVGGRTGLAIGLLGVRLLVPPVEVDDFDFVV